jgi:predicted deacylase
MLLPLAVAMIWQPFILANTTIYTYDDVTASVKRLAENHKKLVSTKIIGYSGEGLPLTTLVIKENIKIKKPAIFVNGAHHGNETITAKCVLDFARRLVETHQSSPVDSRLKHFDFYLLPVVNPDGYIRASRFNSSGIDPNRDYPNKHAGFEGFRLPETRAIGNLLKSIPVVAAAALHSGFKGVLWPWGYSRQKPPEAFLFREIGKAIAEAMGHNVFKQSHSDYPTKGEFIDYAYAEHKILAFTLEIDEAVTVHPSRWQSVSELAIQGIQAMTDRLILTQGIATRALNRSL